MINKTVFWGALIFSLNVIGQEIITFNQLLNGIWELKGDKSRNDIYFNNKQYSYYFKNGANPFKFNSYFYPKSQTYIEPWESKRLYITYKTLSLDSVEFDKKVEFIENRAVVEIIDINKEIKKDELFRDYNSTLYEFFKEDKNQFLMWAPGESGRQWTFTRVLKPSKKVLDFYKKIAPERFAKINSAHTTINKPPFTPTKMYLIKGDEVEVLEKIEVKGVLWLNIRYYGNKTIEGWIKKSDVNTP